MNQSKLLPFIFSLFIAMNLVACSEEDRDTLSAINEMADKLEDMEALADSKFDQDCLGKLTESQNNLDGENISSELQQESADIFMGCLDTIKFELDLTEDEFESADDDEICLNGVKELRSLMPKLTADIQKFAGLPNSTEEERMGVSMAYAFVSTDIIAKGSAAVLNRTVACVFELKEPAEQNS